MGRRRKCRFVADVPTVTVFKPQGVPMGQLYGVAIGLDGFEALRLVDAEGLSQEEAASLMGVSRPTLCRILGEARGPDAQRASNDPRSGLPSSGRGRVPGPASASNSRSLEAFADAPEEAPLAGGSTGIFRRASGTPASIAALPATRRRRSRVPM